MKIKFEKAIAATFLLTAVIVFGTIGFYRIEKWEWVEAFYATVMTITGVGAEGFMPLTPTGKIFISFLALLSVGITFGIILLISEPFLKRWFDAMVRLEDRFRLHTGNVIKRTGKIQEFSKEKIVKSCIKAGASIENAIKVADEVASKFRNNMRTREIGEMTIASLKKYDRKAAESFDKFFRKKEVKDDIF